jgi:hypothetical protein
MGRKKAKPEQASKVRMRMPTLRSPPITGFAHVGYLPNGRVVGISKLAPGIASDAGW